MLRVSVFLDVSPHYKGFFRSAKGRRENILSLLDMDLDINCSPHLEIELHSDVIGIQLSVLWVLIFSTPCVKGCRKDYK